MSVKINLPDELDISPFDLNMLLASKLFDEGLITSGQGAEMVGLSKQAFIKMFGKHKVSVFQYDAAEVEEDVKNA